jgi:tRNA threonylcarbamoyladenosine biosynthesis protein TsaE
MNTSETHLSRSPAETRAIASALARTLPHGAILALEGDLGSGKTTFVQGLADALDLPVAVTSPTYTLVHAYGTPPRLVHMDLYRLSGPDETFGIGLEDAWAGADLVAIEWPDRAEGLLPDGVVRVRRRRTVVGSRAKTQER